MSKYFPAMCDAIKAVGARGGHVAEMCLEIGVGSKETFYRWQAEYPEFREAYQTATLLSQAYYERLLKDCAEGNKEINDKALTMILRNKFKEDYAAEHKDTKVLINNAGGSIGSMSDEALNRRIKELTSVIEHDGTK